MDQQLPSTTEAPQQPRSDRYLIQIVVQNLKTLGERTVENTTRLEEVGAKMSRFERRLQYIETYFIGPTDPMSDAGPSTVELTPPPSSPDDKRRPRRRRDGQESQQFKKQDLERVTGSNKLRCPLCNKALSPGYVLVHASLGKCERR